MDTLESYFARPDTPAASSPVGEAMQRIVAKMPGLCFEEARAQAHGLLRQAAGRKVYKVPPVLSPEERRQRREAFQKTFQPVKLAA